MIATKITDLDKLDKLMKNIAKVPPPQGGDGRGDVPVEGDGGKPEGEGKDPGEGKSWAEMVEDEFPEGKRLQDNIEGMAGLLKRLLEMLAEDKGPEGIKSIMFLLELATVTLREDFYDGAYTDFDEVKEEDVLRLVRMVREMAEEFTR